MRLTIPQHQVTLSGNTAGVLAALSSGTVTLAGGNNITLSQAGNAVTISGAAAPAETQTAISGISASDTLYTSGTVRFTGVGGGITVSTNTGQRIDLSVAAQSVQPETQTFVAGIANSETTYTSGTVNLSVVAGNLTIRSTTGQAFQFSMSQSPETQTAISGIANSQTTYTSGTVSLSELGAITIRSTTGNQFQLSVNAQSVQTQGILSAGVSTGGNTAGNTTVNTGSRLVFVGSGNLTASQGTAAGASTITLSVATQTVQTQSLIQALYDGANSITTGTVRLTDANGVTFSINAQTLSASVNQSLSMFAVSNTTQSTSGTAHKSALSFAGAGIASVGVTGGSVVVSVPAGGGGGDGGVFAGVSTMGNTAGSTGTVSTGNFVLVGTGGVNLSQSTGAAGSAATVTISVPMTTARYWNPWIACERLATQHGQATLHMQPYPIDQHVQFDRFVVPVQYSQATNSTLTVTMSAWVGLYTRNAATLSLLHSGSGTFSINGSGTASSAQNSGPKNMTFAWTSTVTEGDYWLAFISRTTTAGNNASISVFGHTQQNSAWSGLMGVAAGASAQQFLGLGTWSATTSAVPSSVAFSHLTGSGAAVQRLPMVWFLSESA